MLAAAAMSTCSCESSVVEFPIGAVWAAVRSLKFEWCAALSGDGVEPSGETGAIAKTVVACSACRRVCMVPSPDTFVGTSSHTCMFALRAGAVGSLHKLTAKDGAVWTVKVRRAVAMLRRRLTAAPDAAARHKRAAASPTQVALGSIRQVLEISDLKHRITYELVSSEPAAPYAASVSKISLRPVTVTNATFIGTC